MRKRTFRSVIIVGKVVIASGCKKDEATPTESEIVYLLEITDTTLQNQLTGIKKKPSAFGGFYSDSFFGDFGRQGLYWTATERDAILAWKLLLLLSRRVVPG